MAHKFKDAVIASPGAHAPVPQSGAKGSAVIARNTVRCDEATRGFKPEIASLSAVARNDKLLAVVFFFIFWSVFCAFSSAQAKETIASEQTVEALAMLEERFASLSGSLGKMSVPPKLSGTLSLPISTNFHQEGEKR